MEDAHNHLPLVFDVPIGLQEDAAVDLIDLGRVGHVRTRQHFGDRTVGQAEEQSTAFIG